MPGFVRVNMYVGPDGALYVLDYHRRMVGDSNLPATRRAEAINFLALGNLEAYDAFLKERVTPTEPLPVQSAALYALSAKPDESVSQYVLEQWPVLTPKVRNVYDPKL